MQEEKDNLQNEIETMNNSTVDSAATSNDDPIIEIDADGKIIKTRRSTLTLVPNSLFASMFSGRWALELDNNGRIFIDENSELIEIIVDFLRMKKREDPSKPAPPPTVPDDKKDNFVSLLNYYGLSDFFYPPVFLPFDIGKIEVVQPHGSSVVVTRSESKIRFSYDASISSGYFATCKPSLNSSGEGSFWKVTIDTLTMNHWLFLGIIGNLNPFHVSSKDLTAYGWGGECAVKNGIYEASEIGVLSQGDCIYFHLKSNKLTMFNAEKNLKTVIDIDTTVSDTYYINFNFYSPNTEISLEPLTEDECERMLEN